MAQCKLIAMSNPIEGGDEDFNRWYDQQHLEDVASIDGVRAASRFRLAAGDGRWRYLAIYDAEVPDPAALLQEIRRRSGTSLMPVSPSLDRTTVYFSVFAQMHT